MTLITTIIVVLGNLILGTLVLLRNKTNKINRYLFLLAFSVSIWTFSNYISNIITTEQAAIIWGKLTYISAIFIAFSFLFFTISFTEKKVKITKIVSISLSFILIVLIIFTNFIIGNEIEFEGAIVYISYGSYFFIYFLLFIYLLLESFLLLFVGYKKSQLKKRSQYIYLFLSTFIAAFFATLLNLILPFVTGYGELTLFGPLATLILVGGIFYTIVKHKFLDIRLIILRTLTYSIVVVVISVTVVVFILFLPEALAIDNSIKTIIAIIASIFIVIILDPLKRAIARATDKLFFKARVDYQKLLTSLSEVINREIDLDLLLYSMSRKLEHNLKIKNVSIFLEGSVGGAYYKRKGRIDPKTGEKIEENNGDEMDTALDYENRLGHDSNIVRYLWQAKEIIVLEALERKIEDTQNEDERKVLEISKEELDQLDASVVAPVTVGKDLTGIMVFGPKLSGDPYGSEDINLLQLIGPQLASALEKSRLYEEAKQFTERLKKEVAMATMHLRDTNVQLQEANKHLQQLDTAKSEFVSITSHQLRTPMTGIMGYISMILQGDFGKVPKEQEKILSELLEESQRMIRIINLFLNVSKIESGKMELNIEPVQIEEVIEKIMAMVQQPASDKGLKLIYKKPAKPLPKVMGDRDKLGDIVLNFTDNAIKYTDKGSVTLTTKVDGKYMHFAVKDSGRGIEKEEAKKLFTKFVRGFGIAQVNPDGSGLGLYVARRLTEAHHGEIWVDSEGLGKGATFNVKIPLAKEEKPKK
ncbi:MAG: ATP-binding protein [bacterium]|nr:ATP-binding protein [bacterium]